MLYSYSICHPNKPEIEYPSQKIEGKEVIKLIQNYDWIGILKSMDRMGFEEVHYNPSLDFTCLDTQHSLCITAGIKNGQLTFSLWYNRPKSYRPLFGILPERMVMKVIDRWDFTMDEALAYFLIFINKEYAKLERLMNES